MRPRPQRTRATARRRAGAFVAAITLLSGLLAAVSPLVSPVRALDPSADPSAAPSEPLPTPSEPTPSEATPSEPTPSEATPSEAPSLDPPPSPDPAPSAPAVDPAPSATPVPTEIPRYPLVVPTETPRAAPPVVQNGPSPYTSPHMAYGLAADGCATCHRAHTAAGAMLSLEPGPVEGLCFACHDGSGALTDIAARYADPSLPPNEPDTAAWYSHPATDPGSGPRAPTCIACHQPHRADDSAAAATATGWTTSGANLGSVGVAVTNGAAGSSPAYELVADPDREYELCLKCHSGYTDLPAQDPTWPSRWSLDKGVELNPANGSTHPIEAAGSNSTAAMAASLAGGTLWRFSVSDTIRCTNCHGDPAKAGPGATTDAADRLAPHVSPNRGILIAPYRDRLLTPSGQGYAGADFALCWLCHAESPFSGAVGGEAATDFPYHRLHVAELQGEGSGGLLIDTAGAGQGNAVCAECHFRLHSTALAVNPDDRDNSRLVNFAPNVEAFGGVLRWEGGTGGGSCTLVCHGQDHAGEGY